MIAKKEIQRQNIFNFNETRSSLVLLSCKWSAIYAAIVKFIKQNPFAPESARALRLIPNPFCDMIH